jgi:hypothetical protein
VRDNLYLLPEIVSEIFKQSITFSQSEYSASSPFIFVTGDLELIFAKIGSNLKESNEIAYQLLLENLQMRICEGTEVK